MSNNNQVWHNKLAKVIKFNNELLSSLLVSVYYLRALIPCQIGIRIYFMCGHKATVCKKFKLVSFSDSIKLTELVIHSYRKWLQTFLFRSNSLCYFSLNTCQNRRHATLFHIVELTLTTLNTLIPVNQIQSSFPMLYRNDVAVCLV